MRTRATSLMLAAVVGMGTGAVALAANDTGVTGNVALPPSAVCALVNPCGDVNDSGTVTSSDALSVLKFAVGQPVSIQCDVSGSSGSGGLLRTGSTKCYDQTVVTDCDGTGQDAETLAGVALSYTDNGNGTITDNATGLIWEKLDDSNLEGIAGIHDQDRNVSFVQALEKLETFNTFAFGGRTDWRLPNIRELESILNYGNFEPAVGSIFNNNCTPGCTTASCSCTGDSTPTWSSTPYHELPNYGWAVFFRDGQTGVHPRNTALYVRAVAGG